MERRHTDNFVFSPSQTVVLQVLEETGFDIRPQVDPQAFIEYRMNEQVNRLYIVPGVSMETDFEPRTRNEIKVYIELSRTHVGCACTYSQ